MNANKRILFIGFAMLAGISTAWAGAAYLKLKSETPAQGLVYVSKNNTAPTLNQYQQYSPGGESEGKGNESAYTTGDNKGGDIRYSWAKPARGYKIVKGEAWSGYSTKFSSDNARPTGCKTMQIYEWYTKDTPGDWDGEADNIRAVAGGRADTYTTVKPKFVPADAYDVKYVPAVGGTYNVKYAYEKTRQKVDDSEYEFYTLTENYIINPDGEVIMPTGNQSPVDTKSYEADVITLSSASDNFICWLENDVKIATDKIYTYKVTQNAVVSAQFKWAVLGEAEGDLTPVVKDLQTFALKVAIPVTVVGEWSADDFTVTFIEKTDPVHGSIVKGEAIYENDVLIIQYAYTPTDWNNTEVEVTVTPAFSESITFYIRAKAEEVVDYEACIVENGNRTYTGALEDVINRANTLDSKPMVQLMVDKSINTPLSIRKSLTLNLNDHRLISSSSSIISIDAEDIDVQVSDGLSKAGVLGVECSSADMVSVVTFAKKAKLTQNGGTLYAKNTGAGPACGINVCNGSIFYITDGNLTVSANQDARGVNVATNDDYATFVGGKISVTAHSRAYGVWSAGQSNVTAANIDVMATVSSEAYGVYVNGGVAVLDATTVNADAQTSKAYGVYVENGHLNNNAGSIAAAAVTSDVYGVFVGSTAAAVIQQNTVVTAEVKDETSYTAYGVNNLGIAQLTNIMVTATSPMATAIAVNSNTEAGYTAINGGTYIANGGGTIDGLYHQLGVLNIDGGSFKAVGSGDVVYGGRVATDAFVVNATFSGETQDNGSKAYGFGAEGEGNTILLKNCEIIGKSATSKAYAIYSCTNTTVSDCRLQAQTMGANDAFGFVAEKGTNLLSNCSATVYSYTTGAYGVSQMGGTTTIEGGNYSIIAAQSSTPTAQNSLIYGIKNNSKSTTILNNATFSIQAPNNTFSQYAYGIYAEGIVNSTVCTYTTDVRTQAYGVYGKGASSNLSLTGNTITTTAGNGANSYGVYAERSFYIDGDIVTANATTTAAYALNFTSGAVGKVKEGKFCGRSLGTGTSDLGAINSAASAANVQLMGGVYNSSVNLRKYLAEGYQVFALDNIHTDYVAGYRYTVAVENPFEYVCYIVDGNKYATLEAALQYTKDNSGQYTIVMTQSYTLSAGDYELPANASLLIPYTSTQMALSGATPNRRYTKGVISEHICLTFAPNAHLNVSGKMEVSAELYSQEAGLVCYVYGPYGRIHLEEGSLIQLNSGALLYAYGYITGSGEIKVKNNAEVHELFTIGDMKSMSSMVSCYNNNSQKFFPINQYYIENIEVPTTYYYNSRLICCMNTYYNGDFMGDNAIKVIGTSDALFWVTDNDESSWVRKSYDAEHDYQVWEINSSATLGSLNLKISGYSFSTGKYILPIASNFKLHILDGVFKVSQNTEFLPGVQMEINKTASLMVNSGVNVYVMDKDQWPFTTIQQVTFSPSWKNGVRPARTTEDALFNVHGNIDVKGNLFTSNKGEDADRTDGANIYSTSEDAGTVSFLSNATSASSIEVITAWANSKKTTKTINMDPAKLKNNDGTFAATAGTASGEAYIYINSFWQKSYTNGCFQVVGDKVYAKPAEYVELKNTQMVSSKLIGVEESDHTYLTIDNKHLILMDDCQWWEVEPTENPLVFECRKPGYEGFYYYDNGQWKICSVRVTFYSDEAGTQVLKQITTDFGGVPDHSVIANNPEKTTTVDYTYRFYGWKSSVTGTVYNWADALEKANADMYYTPVFTSVKRNYTITLVDAKDGNTVPIEVPYGDMPAYMPTKLADAQYTYTFDKWEPAFVAVTGVATYTAKWLNTLNEYTIIWKNDETTLQTDVNQPYGTTTKFNGALPAREMDDNWVYTFSGWKSSLTGQIYADGSTPAVGGETIYEAQFNTTPRYVITFTNYDGSVLAKAIYTEGEVPAYDGTPARKRDADGYYVFTGWKSSNGMVYAANTNLPVVSGKETYTAQYDYVTELYSVTLCNVDGAGAIWSGLFGKGAIPFYNKNNDDIPVTPAKAEETHYTYVFSGWKPQLEAVSGPATYTAQFTKASKKYTIMVSTADANGTVSGAGTYDYNTTIDIKATANDGYLFQQWDDGNTDNPRTLTVTGDAQYTAFFVAEFGGYVDIVDWTDKTLTINATGFAFSGWPYTVNGEEFGRENVASAARKCNADRTVTIPYTGKPGERVTIEVTKSDGTRYSYHSYAIPHVYTDGGTLTGVNEQSIVVARGGALIVGESTMVDKIYVSPEAELVVPKGTTLTANALILRTTPWQAASLQAGGTLNVTEAYYTRIVADNTQYFQFAIPLSSQISKVRLSNNKTNPYGKTWILKGYSESSRAANGASAEGNNWELLSEEDAILGTLGYELYSNSALYREFYFPVTLPTQQATTVSVLHTDGAAGAAHAGWNALCSPLLGKYKQTFTDVSEAIKISELTENGNYWQHIPEVIHPAVPFYYQAPKKGTLDFSGDELKQNAPRRAWHTSVSTQWLRLTLSDAVGKMLDEANIFTHPDKFSVDYESGYDVAKQSTTGTHAALYSELACGALAFAAVPDTMAESRIPLTVYAAAVKSYTFHLEDNAYLNRLGNVFLRDTETGAVIDLLTSDYEATLYEGTTRGRFYITCVFRAPNITTDVETTVQDKQTDPIQKVFYNGKVYILRNGVVYDLTGRQCEMK